MLLYICTLDCVIEFITNEFKLVLSIIQFFASCRFRFTIFHFDWIIIIVILVSSCIRIQAQLAWNSPCIDHKLVNKMKSIQIREILLSTPLFFPQQNTIICNAICHSFSMNKRFIELNWICIGFNCIVLYINNLSYWNIQYNTIQHN